MNTEEKAKAYDEAIKVINKCETNKYGCIIGIKPSDIFPELKESKDEKVRKVLIELVKCNERSGYSKLGCVSTSSMITWLEKQGKQNPIEWNEYDKEMIGTLIKIFEINYCNSYYKFGGTTIHAHSIINWLKSLKERIKRK